MKINGFSGLHSTAMTHRRSAEGPSSQPSDKTSFSDSLSKASAKQDSIELSRSHTSAVPTLSQTRDRVVAELNAATDPLTIQSLKARIEAGTYMTDAQELADSILL